MSYSCGKDSTLALHKKILQGHTPVREYANEIMYKCCIEGGTFWKNSILDAIILCHVDEENEHITFDNGVILHMKKYEKERCEYTTSLSIIESLYL